MSGTIIALTSALLGSLIGGALAIYGGIVAVQRNEYYRLRYLVKRIFRDTISQVGQHNFPWILVRNDTTDDLVEDILRVMPCKNRIGFKQKWNEYRYDKNGDGTVPDEYEKLGSISGRRLIIERLQNLISLI